MTKSKGKASYMISAVAEQYEIHPQTLRLYEREGLLRPSRSEGNTRLDTDDEDLERFHELAHAGDSDYVACEPPGVEAHGREQETRKIGSVRMLRDESATYFAFGGVCLLLRLAVHP